ncbi:MAG TPA: carbohydrate ABC transporter permease [Tepidisphaeraceae bacterium]|nr:carbohydrate ABC transporter permease [Tepidisphaeraceae bacterium]
MNTSADQAPLEAKPASTAVVAAPPRAFARAENVNPRSGIGNRKSDLLVYALLCAGALMFLVPFYFVLNGSLKTDAEVQAGEFISPTNAPMFGNYPKALSKDRWSFQPALANTVVVTTLTVLGQIVSCSLVGFGFARFRFRGRGILFMIMLSTMMLPAQVTMIPVFVLFKTLGMVDSFWPLVIPAWLASPFFVFMFRQFFSQIPEELLEAARIDGCSNWRIYWQLMLPLSGPVIAIVAIYTFLGAWNDFMGPLIYLNSPENRTLSLWLNGFKGQYGITDAHLLMAASVVCMMPCVILFFAAQRYFVESVASTGLKS